MYRYAFLDEDCICTAIVASDVVQEDMPVAEEGCLGKFYNGETFVLPADDARRMALETAIGVEYLVCLADLGL